MHGQQNIKSMMYISVPQSSIVACTVCWLEYDKIYHWVKICKI